MKIVNALTKEGQYLMAKANRYEGSDLTDIYATASTEKHRGFRDAFSKFYADKSEHMASNFHICSHNRYQFSVAWERNDGIRLITANSDYLVKFPTPHNTL